MKHHLKIGTRTSKLPRPEPIKVSPFENDIPFGRRDQSQNGPAERGFSTTGLADQPEHFPFLERKANSIDCFDLADSPLKNETCLDWKMCPDVFDFEKVIETGFQTLLFLRFQFGKQREKLAVTFCL